MKSVISEFRIWFCNFIIAYIPFHFIRLGYYKHIMNFKIGKGSSIHLGCRFNTAGSLVIEDYTTINQFCHIDNRGGIQIGTGVSISPKVSMVTADHDLNDLNAPGRLEPIVIKDHAFVGYGAIILKDCVLEEGTVIGAASLLTKSTEEYGIYFGVPAKLKNYRTKQDNTKSEIRDYKRLFH